MSTKHEDPFVYSLGEKFVRVVFKDYETGKPVEVTLAREDLYRFSGIMRRVLGPAPT